MNDRSNDARPQLPRRFAVLSALLLLAACSTPAASPSADADDAASQEPASVAAEPSASVDPLAVCEGVEPEGEPLEIVVGTASYSFDPRMIEGPTECQPFVIVFTNSDPPPPADSPVVTTNEHNITIRFENLIGPLLFDGEQIGQTTIRYEVLGLPAGENYLYCKLHPPMTGRILVAPAGS